jgi:C-terminal processing protease CtpA/Prc
MKRISLNFLLSAILLLASNALFANDDVSAITSVIQKYFDGTSKGQPELVKQAFANSLELQYKSAKVISLGSHSNAEKAGIEVGDELVAVYDCKIPGCSASKAKELVTKKAGETILLSFRRDDESIYSVQLILE